MFTFLFLDGTLVDMLFGTGAVKVTPAHDPNDYQCGKRNNLEFIVVLTEDGKIATNGGKFAGNFQRLFTLEYHLRINFIRMYSFLPTSDRASLYSIILLIISFFRLMIPFHPVQ